MTKALAEAGQDALPNAEEYAVLAMAQQQLAQTNNARAALAAGTQIFGAKLPKLESGDIGTDWGRWLTTLLLINEAKGLIGAPPGGK